MTERISVNIKREKGASFNDYLDSRQLLGHLFIVR